MKREAWSVRKDLFYCLVFLAFFSLTYGTLEGQPFYFAGLYLCADGLRRCLALRQGGPPRSWTGGCRVWWSLSTALILLLAAVLVVKRPEDLTGYGFWLSLIVTVVIASVAVRRLPLSKSVRPEAMLRLLKSARQTNTFRVLELQSALLIAGLYAAPALLWPLMLAPQAMPLQPLRLCYALAFALSIFAWLGTGWLLNRRVRKGRPPETTLAMLLGLLLLLAGLAGCALTGFPYASVFMLAFSSGMRLSLYSMERMEESARAVSEVFADVQDAEAWRTVRTLQQHTAAVAGQVLALLILTGLSVYAGADAAKLEAVDRFRSLFLLPALLLLLAALRFALRFPVSDRTRDKLERFKAMPEDDPCHEALKVHLEKKTVAKFAQPFGVRVIRFILKWAYRQRLSGAENLRRDEDNPLVFLCNHGEIHGPIVCVCNIPLPVRTWSIDRVMINREEVTAYLYRYTFSRQRWLLPPLRRPVAALAASFLVWVMQSLESIPVFRDKPTQLMKTFRLTVEALECGDNLLIFPENPNAVAAEHGYEREGLGEFFTGFAMLAAIYYNQTGRRCRFMPCYAHQGTRTLCFGHEIVYDPDHDPREERERICREARSEMLRLCAEQDSKCGKRSSPA